MPARRKPPRKRTVAEKRKSWAQVKKAETQFSKVLSGLARRVGDLSKHLYTSADVTGSTNRIRELLQNYAVQLRPWARTVAERMVLDVARKDAAQWFAHSRQVGRALNVEIETAPTGVMLRQRINEAAALITSLPLEAAQRVERLAIQALTDGTRADAVAAEIGRTGKVTKSRAALIARTEVARTASELVRVRAEHVGSEGYLWRTSRDADVRHEHRLLEGKFIKWNEPPIAGPNGMRYHAGQGPNCFPGSVVVGLDNGCRAAVKSLFAGQIVVLTAGAVDVPVTLNHPILTTRGWLAAQDVEVGDYLIQFGEACRVVERNKHGHKSSFAELFNTLALVGQFDRQPASEFDFYGDVMCGHVDIVTPTKVLTDDVVSASFEGVGKFALANTDPRIGGGRIVRRQDEIGVSSGPCLGNDTPPSFGTQLFESQSVGFTARAHQTEPSESFIDHDRSNVELPGQTRRRPAALVQPGNFTVGNVASPVVPSRADMFDQHTPGPEMLAEIIRVHADDLGGYLEQGALPYKALRVVDKRSRYFFGHVFTMETLVGWYTVTQNAIICKNCRCYPEPVIPEAM